MFNSRKEKIMVCLICISILALGIVSLQYYQEIKENQRQYELFLNHFYFANVNLIQDIEALLDSKPQNEELDYMVYKLEKSISTVETILGDRFFVNEEILEPFFYRNARLIITGFAGASFKFSPLNEDKKLDNDEIILLETLKKYLNGVVHDITSPDVGKGILKENSNLTIDEFNKILRNNLPQNPEYIYREVYK